MKIENIDNTKCVYYTKELLKEDLERIWRPNHAFKIFISHKDNCKTNAEKLKNEFARYGISCFVAHVDIEPTQEWANEIKNALFSCDACIALLSNSFHESKWTDQEVGCCLWRNVPVIPIMWPRIDTKGIISGETPYGLLGVLQAMKYDGSGDYRVLVQNIMKYLLKNEVAQNAYVREIGCCDSFDMANNLATLFEYIPKLKPYQIDEIIDNWKKNPETNGAFGFQGGHGRNFGHGIIHYLKKWKSEFVK